MTLQTELNSYCRDMYASLIEFSGVSIILWLYYIFLIGFSAYGWSCITHKTSNDIDICSVSFMIAMNLEIGFILFVVIPGGLCVTVNCIYPAPITPIPPVQTVSLTPYTTLSYNELYRIQQYVQGHPQITSVHI